MTKVSFCVAADTGMLYEESTTILRFTHPGALDGFVRQQKITDYCELPAWGTVSGLFAKFLKHKHGIACLEKQHLDSMFNIQKLEYKFSWPAEQLLHSSCVPSSTLVLRNLAESSGKNVTTESASKVQSFIFTNGSGTFIIAAHQSALEGKSKAAHAMFFGMPEQANQIPIDVEPSTIVSFIKKYSEHGQNPFGTQKGAVGIPTDPKALLESVIFDG